jgi:hypothetical protein
MIGIPVALVYMNAGEWLIHKYVLHGSGRNKANFWSFHWYEHHRNARRNNMYDPDYERPLRDWNAQTKELAGLIGIGIAHAPLFPLMPFFTGTVWYSLVKYYRSHKRAHLDPAWAEEHLPWHVDHHMGTNQDANWCVTRPWFDNWVGTRVARRAPSNKKERAHKNGAHAGAPQTQGA